MAPPAPAASLPREQNDPRDKKELIKLQKTIVGEEIAEGSGEVIQAVLRELKLSVSRMDIRYDWKRKLQVIFREWIMNYKKVKVL